MTALNSNELTSASTTLFRSPGTSIVGKTKDLLGGNQIGKYSTKEEQLQSLVMGGIKHFFAMFHRPRNKEDKGGGRRSIEDQNAYDVVMTALNSNELTSARLGRLLTRTLSVPHCQIKKG